MRKIAIARMYYEVNGSSSKVSRRKAGPHTFHAIKASLFRILGGVFILQNKFPWIRHRRRLGTIVRMVTQGQNKLTVT